MKKVILAVIAVMAFGFANAQTTGFSKGDIFVSGSFGSIKTGNSNSYGFGLSPSVGYLVSDNIAIGGSVGFGSSKVNGVKEKGFGVSAYSKYYFTPASRFSAFGQAGLHYGNTRREGSTSNEIGANVGVGLSYFLSKHFAIETSWSGLEYNLDDNGGHGADKTASIGLGTHFSDLRFGVVYKF